MLTTPILAPRSIDVGRFEARRASCHEASSTVLSRRSRRHRHRSCAHPNVPWSVARTRSAVVLPLALPFDGDSIAGVTPCLRHARPDPAPDELRARKRASRGLD